MIRTGQLYASEADLIVIVLTADETVQFIERWATDKSYIPYQLTPKDFLKLFPKCLTPYFQDFI